MLADQHNFRFAYNPPATLSLRKLYLLLHQLLRKCAGQEGGVLLDRSMVSGPGRFGFAATLFIIVPAAHALYAQDPASSQEKRERLAEEIPYILHVTTREVVIELVAVDGHDRTVTDLSAGQLRVSEKISKATEIP